MDPTAGRLCRIRFGLSTKFEESNEDVLLSMASHVAGSAIWTAASPERGVSHEEFFVPDDCEVLADGGIPTIVVQFDWLDVWQRHGCDLIPP